MAVALIIITLQRNLENLLILLATGGLLQTSLPETIRCNTVDRERFAANAIQTAKQWISRMP